MRINFNSYRPQNQSFGMAKLTERGQQAISPWCVSENIVYENDMPYTKKDLLAKTLNKKGVTIDHIEDFMSKGATTSFLKNKLFIEKQLLTSSGQKTIKTYLKNQAKLSKTGEMTQKGQVLVDNVIKVFDVNLPNPLLSAKDGKAMLDMVKKYADPVEISKRLSVVSDKIFSS